MKTLALITVTDQGADDVATFGIVIIISAIVIWLFDKARRK